MAIKRYSENTKPDTSLNKIETYDFSEDEVFGYEKDEEMKVAVASEFADAVVARGTVDNLTSTDTNKALSANQGKVLNDRKEDKSNKVTSFQATPDDMHYPSEKLVKDSLDAVEGRVDETQASLLTTKLAVNELERQAQIGNGATLDFSGIGSVALDARATGRANPTVEGLTATNIVDGADIANLGTVTFASVLNHKYFDVLHGTILTGTGSDITVTNDTGDTADIAVIDLTNSYGSTSEPDASDCAKIFSYFDGTKSISMPARVRSVGKNLFDGTFPDKGKALGASGRAISSANRNLSGFIPVKPNTYYTLKLSSNIYRCCGYNKAEESSFVQLISDSSSTTLINFTTNEDVRYIRFAQNAEEEPAKTMLELGSTATPYEPYTDSTLYIADNEEVRSFGATTDLVKIVNGEFVLEKNVNDDATAAISPPVITNLTTSGILQAKPKGTVYFEPYYEGSHQTGASSQITLPYTGTIEAVYGYDEDLVEYLLDSSEYSLTGTTLTITGALENEVFYVQMSRAEPLAPEMSVNVLNNDRVLLNPTNGKFYDYTIGVSGADGALIPEFIFTEVE
ncbi:MAG: hypothetical protein ACOYJC_11630 [Christensenellales bacterium]|jgi:hypothetical protein